MKSAILVLLLAFSFAALPLTSIAANDATATAVTQDTHIAGTDFVRWYFLPWGTEIGSVEVNGDLVPFSYTWRGPLNAFELTVSLGDFDAGDTIKVFDSNGNELSLTLVIG